LLNMQQQQQQQLDQQQADDEEVTSIQHKVSINNRFPNSSGSCRCKVPSICAFHGTALASALLGSVGCCVSAAYAAAIIHPSPSRVKGWMGCLLLSYRH
jgi:hypothetical protein